MIRRAAACVLAATACGGSAAPSNSAAAPAEEPPVALNAEPAVQYPPDLYDQRVEGDVVLRLFVDSTGQLVPESTRVAESSGFPLLDSAAVKGVARLRYAPARRHGFPVATAFLQALEFRHPRGGGAPQAATDSRRQRPDPSVRSRGIDRTPPDTARARRDTGGAAPGSTPPPPAPAPDSAKARPDTNGPAR
ncbi:MAG: energy transducer TonB [Gemmatimonadales bacterium]